MHILIIDTCTERGVLAYGKEQEIRLARELPFGPIQSKFLLPYLAEMLHVLGEHPQIDIIGVGIGPGSYTGIRVGVAVAQTLAYCWKRPLVGVSSLTGFVPSVPVTHYAAILDARMGGVYVQKGSRNAQGGWSYEAPQLLPLQEVENQLAKVPHLVTPFAKTLKPKLEQMIPHANWSWEESSPCIQALLQSVNDGYVQGKAVLPPQSLELLYLRQTEAEREKILRQQSMGSENT